jgi:hypothetical protein
MTTFDAVTLGALRDVQEVNIRTGQHPKTAVMIWVVVADNQVFVRSFRGAQGRWYRDLASGGPATLEWAGRELPVRAVPAADPDSVACASAAFLAKYRASPYAQAMVKPETLPTTLRLDPR